MVVAPIRFAAIQADPDDPRPVGTIHVLDVTGTVSTFHDAELCTAEAELVIENQDSRTVYAAGRWIAYSERL